MEIKTVEYMIRKNLGNYEHEEIKLSGSVSEGEQAWEAIAKIKQEARHALGLAVDPVIASEPTTPVVAHVSGPQTAGWNQDVPPPIPAEAQEKPKRQRRAKKTDDEMETVASPYVKSEEPKSKTEGRDEDLDGSVRQAKATPHITYDRGVQDHKSTLATYLNTTVPNWKTAKSKEEIAKFSESLQGLPFLDAKRNVVPEFETKVKSFFA